jgi:hypothetical protein
MAFDITIGQSPPNGLVIVGEGLRSAAVRLAPPQKSDTKASMVPFGDQKGTW